MRTTLTEQEKKQVSDFQKKVRSTRMANRLKVDDIAHAIGKNKSEVFRMEAQSKAPTQEDVQAICDFFGFNVSTYFPNGVSFLSRNKPKTNKSVEQCDAQIISQGAGEEITEQEESVEQEVEEYKLYLIENRNNEEKLQSVIPMVARSIKGLLEEMWRNSGCFEDVHSICIEELDTSEYVITLRK